MIFRIAAFARYLRLLLRFRGYQPKPVTLTPSYTSIPNPKRPTIVTTSYQAPESNPSVFGILSNRVAEKLPPRLELKTLKPFAIGLAIALVVVLLSFLIYQFFFNTHQELVQVSGYNWSQNVTVQEYQVVHEDSWTTHPSDAYNIDSDYRDTGRDEKIHDGYHTESYTDTCYQTETYSDTERAKVQAFNDFLVFGTVAAASLLSGTILHFLDWSAVNIAAIAPIAMVIGAVLWLGQRRRAAQAG